jgi:hypothetical protein
MECEIQHKQFQNLRWNERMTLRNTTPWQIQKTQNIIFPKIFQLSPNTNISV